MTPIDKEMIDYRRVEEIAKEFLETESDAFPNLSNENPYLAKAKDKNSEITKEAVLIIHSKIFRLFTLLHHGIVISKDKEVEDLEKIHPDTPLIFENILGVKFTKLPHFDEYNDERSLLLILQGIDKFGDLEEFQRRYDEFKSNYIGFEVNQSTFTDLEVNKTFRKKYKISDNITLEKYLTNIISKEVREVSKK